MPFSIDENGAQVHIIEVCSCDASIELTDGGWQETGRYSHPLGIDWVVEWRNTHVCPNRMLEVKL